jgi:hypothetical protein
MNLLLCPDEEKASVSTAVGCVVRRAMSPSETNLNVYRCNAK